MDYKCPHCRQWKLKREPLPKVFQAHYRCRNCGRRYRWNRDRTRQELVEIGPQDLAVKTPRTAPRRKWGQHAKPAT